ncbi:MAG: DUF3303 family protein [Chloroflexi bacterium]|nr:DUF3303 family protein [Chloroflexota bacterium]
MLFISKYKVNTEFMRECVSRFVTAYPAAEFLEGLNLVGRWHPTGDGWAVIITETDNASLITEWGLKWSDLCEISTVPALDDEGMGPVAHAWVQTLT